MLANHSSRSSDAAAHLYVSNIEYITVHGRLQTKPSLLPIMDLRLFDAGTLYTHTYDGLLLIGPLRTDFEEIQIEI